MIKDITIGQYIPGKSFIHKLDPRTKILLSLVYIVNLFLIDKFKGYIFITAFTLFIIFISGIKMKYIYKSLKPILLLIIFTGALNIFMTPGAAAPLFHWSFYTYIQGRARFSSIYVYKINISHNRYVYAYIHDLTN
ncbi:energy-coupling factor transporter transmembrane protein EcfT [Clostridium acetobutylicum]|nr:energy-coupling factor transporter transmembrane protein EcfT [Clostridium acetobutylicum]